MIIDFLLSIDIGMGKVENGVKMGKDGTPESFDIDSTGCRAFVCAVSCLDPVLIKGLASLLKYFHRPSEKINMFEIKVYFCHWLDALSHLLSVQKLKANKL